MKINIKEYTFTTSDNVELSMSRYQKNSAPSKNAVLILHGLGAQSEIFKGAEINNLVTTLLKSLDLSVWLLEWRGSTYYEKKYLLSNHNADEVAKYDIPSAIDLIRSDQDTEVNIHLVGHCIGSMTACMSIAGGYVSNIKSFVCGNMGLYPKLEDESAVKLEAIPSLIKNYTNTKCFQIDPDKMNFGTVDYLLYQVAKNSKSTCDDMTCKMLSFIWGDGHQSTLFKHENVSQKTHDRLLEYLGAVSLSYLEHFQKMLMHSAVVSNDLKINYLEQVDKFDFPLLLLVGDENRLWFDSVQQFYKLIKANFPTVDVTLEEIPGYGHLDFFMGKDTSYDAFPKITSFLQKHLD